MSSYYLAVDGKQTGPFDEETIRQQVALGQRSPDDLCWCEGMTDWQSTGSVLGIATESAIPPPVPTAAVAPVDTSAPQSGAEYGRQRRGRLDPIVPVFRARSDLHQ